MLLSLKEMEFMVPGAKKAIYYVAGNTCCFVKFFIQTFRIWKVKLFVRSLIGKRKRMGNDLIIVWLHTTLTT